MNRTGKYKATHLDDYFGVIAGNRSTRLIVTPLGASYVVQVKDKATREWKAISTFQGVGPLRAFVCAVMDNPPPSMVSAVRRLPDSPRQALPVASPSKASSVAA